MSIFLNGSTHCLLKRLSSLWISSPQVHSASTLCLSCSRTQFGQYQKQQILPKRTVAPAFGSCLSINARSYSSSSPHRKSIITIIPGSNRRKHSTVASIGIIHSRPISASIDTFQKQQQQQQQEQQRQQTSTCIAMIYYAKHGEPDRCLQHFLQLLESQGKLPSHEALHQLARILYTKRHLSGFSVLHDTLLAYYKINPPSGRQSRNLTYIYTMFINLIMSQPSKAKKRPVRKTQRLTASSSPLAVPITMENKTTAIIQLCQEMHQLGLTGSPALYNSLLKFCVMKKDSALAQSLYKELVNICPPTNYTCGILLDLARQQNDSSLMLQVLDEMDLGGIVPDRPMVSTVMLTLCDRQQYMTAIDFVNRLDRYAPQIMGSQYKSVLLDSLNRHYQQYQRKHKHKRQQYPQQKKRKQQKEPASPSCISSSTTATL